MIAEPPDLLISYHASISQDVNANGTDQKAAYCAAGECQPYVYDQGALSFEVKDAGTNRVIWRGWANGSVDGVVNNQQWLEQKIDEIVARILERFPRRP